MPHYIETLAAVENAFSSHYDMKQLIKYKTQQQEITDVDYTEIQQNETGTSQELPTDSSGSSS